MAPLRTKRLPMGMRRRLLLRRSIPPLLLALGCLLSLGATWFVTSTEEAGARAAFHTAAEVTRQQIQSGLNTYIEVVRAGTALLAVSDEINHAEFATFVASLRLRDRYAGLDAIGFSQYVKPRDLGAFVRTIRLDGVTRFRVWPAGRRPEYYPVVFFEPRPSPGPPMLGFDMWTDEVLREAMERARDTGQPSASDGLANVPTGKNSQRPSLVLFIPVYHVTDPLQTVEQRRRALNGFVFGPVSLPKVLPQIVTATTPSVRFDIYDGAVGDPAAQALRSTSAEGVSRFTAMELVHVAGRNWRVALRSSETRAGMVSPTGWRTLAVGLLISILIFVITRGQGRAWETAACHEVELRASEQLLRKSESELQHVVTLERGARTQVEAAGRVKDEFLATLSHELRTPLNTVLGWLTMLRTGSMREDQRRHALEVIERNARLQAQLIEDLLDVSRIVTGKVQVDLRPLAVGPIVSTVLESIRPTAEAKGVSLRASVGHETPWILGDASRVQQILWNLLSNAIKFTPAGGHVSVELTSDNCDVQVCIRDTGIGIPPEFLPHVFERFRQADSSTTRAHTGVGLGLAIVRDLVELHGGSVAARSEGANRGSLFVVSFPAAAAQPEGVVEAVARPMSPPLDGVRVLVVDDDSETRDLLSQALGATGARVTTAESARQAFDQLRSAGADVLVSDIGMPEEDGLSLMRRIRSLSGRSGKIPAIALTAYARLEDRDRAMEAGFQLHFSKPVELAELQAGVATLTRTRQE